MVRVICPRALHFNTRLAEIFPVCLDHSGDSNSLCMCVSTHTHKHTDTHTHGLGQLPFTVTLSSLHSLFSGYESPFESKTHQRPMSNEDMTN